MLEPTVANASLQNLPECDDLIVKGTSRGRLPIATVRCTMDAVVLNLSGGHL